MKPKRPIESLIYAVLIVLSLIAVGLAFVSPGEFTNLKLIYGVF